MPRELMEKPMAQVSSATSQQKWKYKSYKVYIASQENETQWYNVKLNDMTIYFCTSCEKNNTLS